MLREITEKDLDKLLLWRNHESIRSYMYDNSVITAKEHEKWFNEQIVPKHIIAFIYNENGNDVGMVNFKKTTINNVYNWGFYVAPHAKPGTGMRLGYEALDYIFNKGHAYKICGQVLGFNESSKKFHLKLGFQEEDILIKHYFRD